MDKELLAAAAAAFRRINARKDENVEQWADALAKDLVAAGEVEREAFEKE